MLSLKNSQPFLAGNFRRETQRTSTWEQIVCELTSSLCETTTWQPVCQENSPSWMLICCFSVIWDGRLYGSHSRQEPFTCFAVDCFLHPGVKSAVRLWVQPSKRYCVLIGAKPRRHTCTTGIVSLHDASLQT